MNLTDSPMKPSTAVDLFNRIERTIKDLGGWTSIAKAHTFAAAILTLRPEVTVEIGVWCGRGSLAIALALKEVGRGIHYAIDPWSAAASVEGQTHPADVDHWGKADHEAAYNQFLFALTENGLNQIVKVVRSRSEQATVPGNIGLLVVDGNHGDAAITDVKRFAPNVKRGGLVFLDDLDWSTGSVRRAEAQLKAMGFLEMYRIENGAFFQRV